VIACTRESHEAKKADPVKWATEVDHIGEMEFGDGERLQLANCRDCCSTLAVEVQS
jgi:hypothetical protein